jgi:hypothetical protein
MKWIGLILALAAAWFLHEVWHDTVEGKVFRPIAILGIVAGVVLFFEGLKRDVVAELRRKNTDSSDR